jgi:hypothetical protein
LNQICDYRNAWNQLYTLSTYGHIPSTTVSDNHRRYELSVDDTTQRGNISEINVISNIRSQELEEGRPQQRRMDKAS